MKLERLAISCGGTGGHFYPGLSIAREFNAAGGSALLILGGKHAKKQAETAASFGVRSLPVSAVPLAKNPLKLLMFCVKDLHGYFQTRKAFAEFKPQALLCMGSFASLPPAMAAKTMKIPLFLHDGNARLGKANKKLSRFAKALALSFPSPDAPQCQCPTILTGMPLRQELILGKTSKEDAIAEINRRWGKTFSPEFPTLLVFGGSLGASSINRTSRMIPQQNSGVRNIQLIHLSGPGKLPELENYYEKANRRNILLLESSPDMHLFYSAADMIISRAGGSTVAELAYYAKFCVVVPYPFAAEDHQTNNAQWLTSAGGAMSVRDADCNAENFTKIVRDWLENQETYRKQAEKLSEIAMPDASKRVLDMIENITFSGTGD